MTERMGGQVKKRLRQTPWRDQDTPGREATCRCPMTWGCRQPANGDDGLCAECRADCPAGREATDHTGRGWVFGDEPCPYDSGSCTLPLRTHTHYSHGPGDPFHVAFYDEGEPGPLTPPARETT